MIMQLQAWRRRVLGADGGHDAAGGLFRGIRRRLTLWYAGVLAAVLLLAGIIIYNGTQRIVTAHTTQALQDTAQHLKIGWLKNFDDPIPHFCNGPGFTDAPYIACFGPDGTLLNFTYPVSVAPGFISENLVKSALANGSATDIVTTGGDTIERYAVVVTDPQSHATLGVLEAGVSVAGEMRAEQTLLTVLIILGIAMIAVVAGSGLWLSAKALEPARLAFARQQAFIADASHELRTPLTLMRADAEVLQRSRDRLSAADAALVDDIVAEASHLTNLANRLLMLARLDEGAVHAETEVIRAGELARMVAQRVQALAGQYHVTVSAEVADNLLALGDPVLLEEALLILVDNAIKHNRPKGSVRISAAVQGSALKLAVSDSGPGIAAEHLARLGERFYRVDKARSRANGGAGLGLSIARACMAAQGGDLTLTSKEGKGTTATLSLPAVTASEREAHQVLA